MPMRSILATLALCGSLLLLAGGTAANAGGHQPEPTDALTVVENFLLARDIRDPWGAADWCAALLELKDIDGSWFIDTPTTSAWLRQLTDRYFIVRLGPLVAEGNTVSWTERLTLRSLPYQEALRSSTSIEVQAVVRDGKIAYLSGPYPLFRLRQPTPSVEHPTTGEETRSTPTLGPATLFVGSALCLSLFALLAARGRRLIHGAADRDRLQAN